MHRQLAQGEEAAVAAEAEGGALFRREFDQFWGPRMEDAFRFALLTLYEANEALCRDDPVAGRDRQHTVLQVPTVLGSPGFRRRLLPLLRDPLIGAWWRTYFDRLDRKFALEIINPVQTKVSRFAASATARAVPNGGGSPPVDATITALFSRLLNIGLTVAVSVSAFFLMWGAFVYMSAGGSPRQMESGKSAMLNALVGLGIALSARVIAGLIQQALAAAA